MYLRNCSEFQRKLTVEQSKKAILRNDHQKKVYLVASKCHISRYYRPEMINSIHYNTYTTNIFTINQIKLHLISKPKYLSGERILFK